MSERSVDEEMGNILEQKAMNAVDRAVSGAFNAVAGAGRKKPSLDSVIQDAAKRSREQAARSQQREGPSTARKNDWERGF